MGVQLLTVLPNPRGNDFKQLQGLEWEIEDKCPSLHLFPSPCLRRVVDWHEMCRTMDEMKLAGFPEEKIFAYFLERRRQLPDSDGDLSPEDRQDLEKRSWRWEGDRFSNLIKSWTLDTRFLLSIEFLPQICFLKSMEGICLDDFDFRERHLNLSRELARMLGVQEFLIVLDGAADSSAICCDFTDKDFLFQKKWLLDNVGPAKKSLAEMKVEFEDWYDLEGYYWEAVADG